MLPKTARTHRMAALLCLLLLRPAAAWETVAGLATRYEILVAAADGASVVERGDVVVARDRRGRSTFVRRATERVPSAKASERVRARASTERRLAAPRRRRGASLETRSDVGRNDRRGTERPSALARRTRDA